MTSPTPADLEAAKEHRLEANRLEGEICETQEEIDTLLTMLCKAKLRLEKLQISRKVSDNFAEMLENGTYSLTLD